MNIYVFLYLTLFVFDETYKKRLKEDGEVPSRLYSFSTSLFSFAMVALNGFFDEWRWLQYIILMVSLGDIAFVFFSIKQERKKEYRIFVNTIS